MSDNEFINSGGFEWASGEGNAWDGATTDTDSDSDSDWFLVTNGMIGSAQCAVPAGSFPIGSFPATLLGIYDKNGMIGSAQGSVPFGSFPSRSFPRSFITIITGTINTSISVDCSFQGKIGCGGSISAGVGGVDFDLPGAIGIQGELSSQIQELLVELSGSIGVSGAISASIYTGIEMAGKLGVSGPLLIALEDMGCYILELSIGAKIYQLLVSTKSGSITTITSEVPPC